MGENYGWFEGVEWKMISGQIYQNTEDKCLRNKIMLNDDDVHTD